MKWQYEVIKIFSNDPDFIKEKLNGLSQDGWRLIACDIKEYLYVFERLDSGVPFKREGFRQHTAPVELTPQEKKLRDYFD
jgi:hypothetical protein